MGIHISCHTMKANQEVYRGFPAYRIKALNDLAVSLQLVWRGGARGESRGKGEAGQGSGHPPV